MTFFTYAELKDTFSSYKRFSNPISNELFDENVINKLYYLSSIKKRIYESEECYQERVNLGKEIDRVRFYISTNNGYLEELIQRYENCSHEYKEDVEKTLISILHSSMYMRNWDGIGNFPLSSEQTNYDYDKQIEIDHRVTQSLFEIEKNCEEINHIKKLGNFILNLPLMEYHHISNTFITVNDRAEGLTIKDRIAIIRKGENNNGIASCIRVSSNKICATAYFYMNQIGMRIPFNISEVSNIY